MTNRPLSICRRPGCPALLERPGYCPAHQTAAPATGFAALDARRTEAARTFYASRRWTETSLRHRKSEPLCRRCRAAGRVTPAQMVHHDPPVEELLAAGLSPYADQYLESLCNRCHLAELRKKYHSKRAAHAA